MQKRFLFRPSAFFLMFVCILLLILPFAVFAQEGPPVIPEFPAQLSVVLGVLSSIVVAFFKSKLPENDLVRLVVAAALSVATSIIAAFAVGLELGNASNVALFLSAVYAYSQVSWTFYKAIREYRRL